MVGDLVTLRGVIYTFGAFWPAGTVARVCAVGVRGVLLVACNGLPNMPWVPLYLVAEVIP